MQKSAIKMTSYQLWNNLKVKSIFSVVEEIRKHPHRQIKKITGMISSVLSCCLKISLTFNL